MTKKTETIDLKGKAYATVPTRIKEFRQDCPNGLIETKPQMQSDGSVIFSTRILKDKSNPSSGEATGHSIGKITGDKAFEKLETISIGRALAILGYMASGEIASSEEMEEFLSQKQEKLANALLESSEIIGNCDTVESLKTYWTSLPAELITNNTLIEAKNVRYKQLTATK